MRTCATPRAYRTGVAWKGYGLNAGLKRCALFADRATTHRLRP